MKNQLRFTCMAGGLLGMMGRPAITLEEINAHRPMEGEHPTGDSLRNTCQFHRSMHEHIPSGHIIMIDGSLEQMDLPVEEQDMLMLLPERKTLKVKCLPDPEDSDNYLLYEYDYDNSSEPVASEVDGRDSEEN